MGKTFFCRKIGDHCQGLLGFFGRDEGVGDTTCGGVSLRSPPTSTQHVEATSMGILLQYTACRGCLLRKPPHTSLTSVRWRCSPQQYPSHTVHSMQGRLSGKLLLHTHQAIFVPGILKPFLESEILLLEIRARSIIPLFLFSISAK